MGAVQCQFLLGPAACFYLVVPRQSWLRSLRCGSPPFLADVPVGVVSHQSWLGPHAGFCWSVPFQSCRKSLWVLLADNRGFVVLLAFVGLSLANPG